MSDDALPRAASDWLADPGTKRLFDALEKAGGTPRFVGGCVRDALLGRSVADIDVAIDLEPNAVLDALDADGIRVVPTGIDHGTVTAVFDTRTIEVTSLRKDVETDGRRAVVAFTRDWREDAARRDFTFNALYVDRAGGPLDFHGGRRDLELSRLRFIGAPDDRIREDVLRLFRFFRFMAQLDIGDPDPEGLAACRRGADLLPKLSAERVAAEFLRLLAQTNPVPAVRLMREIGALTHWLPEALDETALAKLIELEEDRGEPDPVRRLGALCAAGGAAVGARLKLSASAQARLALLDTVPAAPVSPRAVIYRLGVAAATDTALVGIARGETAWRSVLDLVGAWTPPRFPLTGADVLALGVSPGPEVGARLKAMEDAWINADFAWDRDALLSRLTGTREGEHR